MQILKALALLRDAGIIHCDLKPENILLTTRYQKHVLLMKWYIIWLSGIVTLMLWLDWCSPGSAEIKLIDFGSACREDRTVYSYIQVHSACLGMSLCIDLDLCSFSCLCDIIFRLHKCIFTYILDHIAASTCNLKHNFKVHYNFF